MILSPVPVFLFHRKLLEYHWFLQQFRPQHNIRIRRLFPARLAYLRSLKLGLDDVRIVRQVQLRNRNAVTAGLLLAVPGSYVEVISACVS